MGFIFSKFSKLGSGAKPPSPNPSPQWLRQTNFSNPPTPFGLATPLYKTVTLYYLLASLAPLQPGVRGGSPPPPSYGPDWWISLSWIITIFEIVFNNQHQGAFLAPILWFVIFLIATEWCRFRLYAAVHCAWSHRLYGQCSYKSIILCYYIFYTL